MLNFNIQVFWKVDFGQTVGTDKNNSAFKGSVFHEAHLLNETIIFIRTEDFQLFIVTVSYLIKPNVPQSSVK
jgi:hypothetical protein